VCFVRLGVLMKVVGVFVRFFVRRFTGVRVGFMVFKMLDIKSRIRAHEAVTAGMATRTATLSLLHNQIPV
jgi:hypothetical protein